MYPRASQSPRSISLTTKKCSAQGMVPPYLGRKSTNSIVQPVVAAWQFLFLIKIAFFTHSFSFSVDASRLSKFFRIWQFPVSVASNSFAIFVWFLWLWTAPSRFLILREFAISFVYFHSISDSRIFPDIRHFPFIYPAANANRFSSFFIQARVRFNFMFIPDVILLCVFMFWFSPQVDS